MNLAGDGSTAGMPSTLWAVHTRIAVPSDREFVLSMVPRMVASSPAHWRNPRKVRAAYLEVIQSILGMRRTDAALLVAVLADAPPLGIALLTAASDCFTHQLQGYLAQFVIVDGLEESPVMTELTMAADLWANSCRHRVLSPGEFWKSHPAGAMRNEVGFRGQAASAQRGALPLPQGH